jgi:predicted lipid-binding transport protein (Tim44 family)
MKKIFLLTFMFVFAFNAVSFAAVSGSKSKVSTPSPKPPTTQSSPSSSTTSGYKPSAPAQSYSEKAPAAAAKPNTQTAQQQTGSSFLRNAGLFAGGMFLGSMLGNMFGFGQSGMFADIIGMIFNVMLLAGVVMAGRFLWDKFKNRNNNQR